MYIDSKKFHFSKTLLLHFKMLTQLPYETCANIAQFLSIGPIGDLFRVASGLIQIREIRDGCTYMNGVLHSFNDLPAKEYANGDKFWYRNGKLHRDNDLPAREYADGDKFWYRDDKIHRDNDLPAGEYAGGDKSWYRNGKLRRDNGLPAQEDANGTKFWYRNEKLHRHVYRR